MKVIYIKLWITFLFIFFLNHLTFLSICITIYL
nr:MAG TPA: hypothetical protein [Caudoviricetes sp.]